MSNPDHSDKLTVLGSEPFNAEPDLGSLLDNDLTPVEHVYCRNHCKLPGVRFWRGVLGLNVKGNL